MPRIFLTLIYAADLAFFKEIRSKVQLTKIVKKFKVYYGTLFMKKEAAEEKILSYAQLH